MTKVKICGITDKETLLKICQLKVDYVGFVFAKSPRQITPEKAAAISEVVPKTIKKVGVFVSPTIAEVIQIATTAKLDVIQIHGKVPKGSLPLPVIIAQSPDKKDFNCCADYLLLDAPAGKYAGGNGTIFDWKKIEVAKIDKTNLFIAGGLNSQNVTAAIAYFSPFAVDVSSGVETGGKKDLAKITAFIQKVKTN